MPPSPLEERIGVLQRPKTLALRLTHSFVTHGSGGEKPLSPSAPIRAGSQDPCEAIRRSSVLLPGHSHTLDLKSQGRGSERGLAWPTDPKQGEKKGVLSPQLKALLPQAKLKKRGLKENANPLGDGSPSSTLSSPATTMHPLKCGCWGCWRLMRCEEAGAKSSLRSLGCFSSRSSLRSLGCPGCSPQSMKKLGCFSCAPVALRSLACLACNLSVKSASSSCSFCSSDPIVAYDPRVGSSPAPSCYGGDEEDDDDEDDDYTVRNIWPDELAKKMHKSPLPPSQPPWSQPQSSPLILDCRNLVEFTKTQLQGAMRFGVTDAPGRRRFQQGKLAVLDFLSSRGACDGRDSSRQCLWSKEGSGCGGVLESPPASPPKPPKTQPMQGLHLVLDLVHRDEQGLGKRGNPIGSDAPEISDEVGSPLTPDLENAELSPILPFLYLGNERDAQNLEILLHLNVGHVLNVTTHLPLYHADSGRLHYKRLPATDNNRQDLRQYFEEAFEFIEEAHQSGKGVLVHCQAGVSRSATIVIAYLMKHTLMTMGDAYKYVKGRRPVISPNLNFMGQLLQFETDLNAGVTPRILTPKLAGVETEEYKRSGTRNSKCT
ncbi:dual specificity protein phosphatase 10-like isoform X1 [Ahaetulla prasina]|uniref:dual specificity protein phosphatase 10-like isoform X1 n=1 Tax=Ahaetulla prasina TaxID=499056 RepID=UPI0026482AD3|nr:dual specificity protein phosphatase 10-like isoform X1 [Ahaetulla prasina]XP_058016590.1 dual specificity protein phosphatase 10-like isoform X1 [Ahaetulla prasina]